MNGRFFNTNRLGVLEIFLNKTLAEFLYRYPFLVCALYHFIVNIGEILHKLYVIAAIFKIAAHCVENNKRARVADVEIVVHSRSAGIHFYLVLIYRYKFLFFAR